MNILQLLAEGMNTCEKTKEKGPQKGVNKKMESKISESKRNQK